MTKPNEARSTAPEPPSETPANPHGWRTVCTCCGCPPSNKMCKFNCACHDAPAPTPEPRPEPDEMRNYTYPEAGTPETPSAPLRCNNPLHYHTNGSPEPHEIGPSCMAEGETPSALSERAEENNRKLRNRLKGRKVKIDPRDIGSPALNEEAQNAPLVKLNNYLMAHEKGIDMCWIARVLEEAEQEAANLRSKLSTAERETNCEKLKRERETKRHWQGRAEAAEAELARVREALRQANKFVDGYNEGSLICNELNESAEKFWEDLRAKTAPVVEAALRTGGEPR